MQILQFLQKAKNTILRKSDENNGQPTALELKHLWNRHIREPLVASGIVEKGIELKQQNPNARVFVFGTTCDGDEYRTPMIGCSCGFEIPNTILGASKRQIPIAIEEMSAALIKDTRDKTDIGFYPFDRRKQIRKRCESENKDGTPPEVLFAHDVVILRFTEQRIR